MNRIILISLCFVFAGCSQLQTAADKVADGVIIYCTQPQTARQLIRESVNTELSQAGHRAEVTCAGDIE